MEDVVHESFSLVRAVPMTYNSFPLICNSYMRMNREFFLRFFSNANQSKELIVVHPGTDSLLPIAITCAAFASVLLGEINIKEHYRQFNPGEIVIRGRKRYRFVGVDNDTCILKLDESGRFSNETAKIPLARGLDIRKYRGNSIRTGAQGSNRSLTEASIYLQNLVGSAYRNQAVAQPLCTMVVCSREKAQRIIDGMAFADKTNSIRFADVFPTAWAHSTDDMDYYFGDVGKSDPTIIFTNRISLAREILFEDDGYEKRIFTVIFSDLESTESKSEIDDIRELIGDRRHGRIITLQSDDKITETLNAFISSNAQTILWSPEVLISTLDDLSHQPENPEDRAVMDAINKTIDNNVERVVIDSKDVFSQIRYCKSVLKKMIRISERSSDIDEYILCANGLLNLFEQAVFTMEEYERYIESKGIRLRSPKKQIEKLYELSSSFPFDAYKEDAQIITLAIEDMYQSLLIHNFKRDELLRRLQTTHDEGKSCCVVVTKRSYVEVTGDVCSCFSQVPIIVSSHLSRDIGVDRLFITATPNIKRDGLNPLAGKTASETVLFEYDDETVKNNCYQRMIERAYATINQAAKRSAPEMFGEASDMLSFNTNHQIDERELDEAEKFETELAKIDTDIIIGETLHTLHTSSTTLRAIRLVEFDTGEWALFSQYYMAYVFDEREKKLVEKPPIDLMPGDVAIFSTGGEEIADFVDDILNQLISLGNKALSEHYERSKHWKKVLSDYMRMKGLTHRDISNAMGDLGHPRHAVTVGTWLREDSLIVGPRDEDAFIAIGLASENNEIANNSKLYKESCDYIRRQRMRILDYVQSSIIQSVTGGNRSNGKDTLSEEETSYLGDVQKYARKLIIERIITCERDVPSHLMNRPVGR